MANSSRCRRTARSRPTLAKTKLADGRTVDFIVRQGAAASTASCIVFAMLAPFGEDSAKPDLSLWDGRLLYWFMGGVAIGHAGHYRQRLDESGHPRPRLRDRQFQRQQHQHALQPAAGRRNRDDDQGSLRQALRRAHLHRRPGRLRRARSSNTSLRKTIRACSTPRCRYNPTPTW